MKRKYTELIIYSVSPGILCITKDIIWGQEQTVLREASYTHLKAFKILRPYQKHVTLLESTSVYTESHTQETVIFTYEKAQVQYTPNCLC